MTKKIKKYNNIQSIAIQVLHDIKPHISEGATEKEIAEKCSQLFKKTGITDCWHHGVMAFVLVGERTTLSLSGRDYAPSDLQVQENDLVTIDVSPVLDGYWGDCARSFVIESGRVASIPAISEFSEGLAAQNELHGIMKEIATPDMEMHQLYITMNKEIESLGYKNLDFNGNLGHSIEKDIGNRRYIESGSGTKLGEVSLFTFEPHISKIDGRWGFKHENIYYFDGDKIQLLGSII